MLIDDMSVYFINSFTDGQDVRLTGMEPCLSSRKIHHPVYMENYMAASLYLSRA